MAKNKFEIDVLVNDKGSANLDKVNEGLKETGDSAESSGKGFGKMAIGIGVAVGALTALVKVSKEFVEVAQKQELAEKGLEIALKKQGGAADEAFKSIKKLASARQDVTAVGDEITLQFANILALGGQTGDQIEALVPTIQDLGAAYELAGKGTADYNKIATQVNKLIKEGVGDLSRFGIVLTDTEKKTIAAANETERQAIVMDKVSAAAGGMAEVLGETSKGQMTQFNNIVGDIMENLGFLILDLIKPLIGWFKKLATGLRNATDRGAENAGVLSNLMDILRLITEATFAFWEIVGDLIGLLAEMTGASEGAGGAMEFLRKAIRVVRIAIVLLKAGAKGTVGLLRELKEVAIEFWDAITELDFDKLGDILAGGATRMADAFKKGFKGTVDEFNRMQAALGQEGPGNCPDGFKWNPFTKKCEKVKDGGGKDDAFARWKAEQDIINAAMGVAMTFAEMQKLFHEQELLRIAERAAAEKKAQEEFISGYAATVAKQDAIDEQADKDEVKRGEDAEKAEKKRQAQMVSGLQTIFGMSRDLAGDSWESKKAFAMSEAAIATALAVTENLGNPILAFIIGALGAIQIGKIASEKKPSGFAEGGFTGSAGRGDVAGVVHGQEFVTNADATAQHRTGLELINAGISPQDAFDLDLPGDVPEIGGGNAVTLNGTFKIEGTDLVYVVAETFRQETRASM